MIANDIIENVVAKVQDSSFDEDAVLALINEGRLHIASLVDLPALQKGADLTATAAASSVLLPTDYHKGIFWVWSTAQNRRIGSRSGDYYNLLTFMEDYPGQAGRIDAVCVDGDYLLYKGAADDTLKVRYYAQPATITAATASPTELPYQFQRKLIVAYCCKEIFAEIEQGMEGAKVDTDFWSAQFARGVAELELFVARNKPREAKYVRDMSQ